MEAKLGPLIQGFALTGVVGGLLVLAGYGFYEAIAVETGSGVIKVALGAVGVGGLVLFMSVLRQRVIERKTDKYKDVRI
jgi:hypothetical protein